MKDLAVVVLSVLVGFGAVMPRIGTTSPPIGETTRAGSPDEAMYSKSGYDLTPLDGERVEELARGLSPEERKIILRKGTEPAFCGTLLDNKKNGVYVCRLCGLPLFDSGAKFTSGTGWPSFFRPFDPDHVATEDDTSLGMERTEILCARCRGHLGHVFEDGPEPTGLRYCLNSASLRFFEEGEELPPESRPVRTEVAYFAGGCFWGVEHNLQKIPGVIAAVSGYQGGTTEDPTYREVCTGATGHAETVKVVYDPERVNYDTLLRAFFMIHDPTQLNRQGPDHGPQYRSAIFVANDDQMVRARSYVERLQAEERFRGRRIVTQIEPAGAFYEAEAYHQDYHARNGGRCAMPLDLERLGVGG